MHPSSGALRLAFLAAVLPLAAAGAATRTLSVAAGACRDTDLVQLQAAFSSLLADRLGADAVEPRRLLARARPAPPPALEELQRQLEAAQARFYAGQHEGAAALLRELVDGLERSPPGPRAWKLLSAARVLQGMVFRGAGKSELAQDAFRRVLRVDRQFGLDPDDYSPSTIAAFEAVRRELQAVRGVPLAVVSRPPGAQVFLDGALVGRTPYAGAFPPASYHLVVTAAGAQAFPRRLSLEREATVEVDLAFEGSLSQQMPLCVSGAGDEAVGHALKLGAWAGAENVVLLRLLAHEQGSDWLEAALLDVQRGTRLRAGGMRLVAARQAGGLDALVGYVLTGQGRGPVVPSSELALERRAAVAQPPSGSPGQAGAGGAAAGAGPPGEQVAGRGLAQPRGAAPLVSGPPPGRGPGPRIAGAVLLGAGAAAGAAGLATWFSGAADRELYEALLDPSGQLPPLGQPGRAEAEALAPRVAATTGATVALCAGGGALALAGAVLVAFFGPEAVQVGAVVTPGGGVASLGGSF